MWTPPPVWTAEEEDSARTRELTFTRVLLICLLACLIVVVPIVVIVVVGTERVARIFVAAVPEHPSFVNALAFFGVNALIIITAIPLWALGSMVVGFTFGFWAGFALNYVTIVVASFTCFTLGRYVFLDTIRDYLNRRRLARIATRVVESNDFKFLVLFRFMPLPLAVKNYLPACIKVSPLFFLLSVMVSATLFTPVYTFIGSSTKQLANLYVEHDQAEGEGAVDLFQVSGVQIVIVAVALLAVIATMVLSYLEWQKIADLAEDTSIATPRTPSTGRPLIDKIC